MKTASTSFVAFLTACVSLVGLEQIAAAAHLNQALLGHVTVLAGCGCAGSSITGDCNVGNGDHVMNYSLGIGQYGGRFKPDVSDSELLGCGCGRGLQIRSTAASLNAASRAPCVGRCGLGRVVKGSALHGKMGGKVCAFVSKVNPTKWLHTPSDTGAGTWFNCGCNGSYKFPVPPLSTYHWTGMFSHQLMTDYQSPWRFPAVRPFGKEHGPESYEFLPPEDAEPITSAEHSPVSFQMESSPAEPVDDVRPMSEVMASLYGE